MDLNWGLNICYEYTCYLISCLWYILVSIVLAPHAAFQFLMSKLYNGQEVTDDHPPKINIRLMMGKKTDDKAVVTKTSGETSPNGFFQKVKTFHQKARAELSDKMSAIKRKTRGIEPKNGDKDSEKYVGLRNQGSTCYLNALLQCLYHTPKFREKLSTNTIKINETYLAVDNIFHKLDEKFEAATTYKLTEILGLSSYKQQDVPEIFQLLLNALDVDTAEGPCFKEVFWSTMVNLMQCLECHNTDGYQTAMNIAVLPLAVIPTPDEMQPWSVANALEQFQTTKLMSEENQISCSKCKKKTDTTLRQTFTRLPPVLVVQLKRFEYIFRFNYFAKIHDEVLINRTLDVQYEVEAQLEKKSYELFAICDHHGEFWGGHYTAIINPEGRQQWYRFNDSSVDIVNETSLAKYDRSRTAYLLMYREKSESNVDKSNSSVFSQGQVDTKVLKDQKNWSTEDDSDEVSLVQVEAMSTSTTPEPPGIFDQVSDNMTAQDEGSAGKARNNIKRKNMFTSTPEKSDNTEQLSDDQTPQKQSRTGGNTNAHETCTVPTSTTPEASVISEQVPDAQTLQKECRAGGPPNTHETETVFTCKTPQMCDITEKLSDNQTPQKQDSAEGYTNTNDTYTTPTSTTPETSAVSEKVCDMPTAPEEGSAAIFSNTFKIDTWSISKTPETSDITEHMPNTQTSQGGHNADKNTDTHERETMPTSKPETSVISEQLPDAQTLQKECRAGGPPNTHETETVFTYKPPQMCDVTEVFDNQTPQKQDTAEGYTNTHETYNTPSSTTPGTSAVSEKVSDTQTSLEEGSAAIFSNTFKIDTGSISKTPEASDITEHVPDSQTSQEEVTAEEAPNTHERETMSTSAPNTPAISEQVSNIQTALEEDSAGRAPNTHEAATPETSNNTEQVSDFQTSQEEGSADKTPNTHERETLSTSTLETSDIPEHVSDIQTALKEGSAGRAPSTHETETISTSKHT